MKRFVTLLFVIFNSSLVFAQTRTVLSGAIKSDNPVCSKNDYQIFLSQEKQLLHQFNVPHHGTFAIDVVPGRYELVAKNVDKCVFRSDTVAKSGTVVEVNVSPDIARQPANEVGPGCMCFRAPCPCQTGGGGTFTPPPYITPTWNPWWMYQAPFYSNFYYPGPWMGWGMNGGFYPGGGHIGLAKPNVYIHGKNGTKVSVKVEALHTDSNWLVTVPKYSSQGWQVMISGPDLRESSARYPYLYYDMRTGEVPLQAERGFCDERNEALKKMSAILNEVGFEKKEVKDFEEHWQIKMPPQRVCVFPQLAKELDQLVSLKVTPKPNEILRVVFVVAYENITRAKYSGKFVSKPTTDWSLSTTAPKRRPATANDLRVHEWGVAFIFE